MDKKITDKWPNPIIGPVTDMMFELIRSRNVLYNLTKYPQQKDGLIDLHKKIITVSTGDRNPMVNDTNFQEIEKLLASISAPFRFVNIMDEPNEWRLITRISDMFYQDAKKSSHQLLNEFLAEWRFYMVPVVDSRPYYIALNMLFNGFVRGSVLPAGELVLRDVWNLMFMRHNINYFIDQVKLVVDNGIAVEALTVQEVLWDGHI